MARINECTRNAVKRLSTRYGKEFVLYQAYGKVALMMTDGNGLRQVSGYCTGPEMDAIIYAIENFAIYTDSNKGETR